MEQKINSMYIFTSHVKRRCTNPINEAVKVLLTSLPLRFLFSFSILTHIPRYKYCSCHKEIVKCYSAQEQVETLYSHLWAAPSGSRLVPAAPGSLPHRLPVRYPAGVTSELESPGSKTCSTVLVVVCQIMALYLASAGPPVPSFWLWSMPGQIWPQLPAEAWELILARDWKGSLVQLALQSLSLSLQTLQVCPVYNRLRVSKILKWKWPPVVPILF